MEAEGSDFFLPLTSKACAVGRDALVAPREREWGLSWIDRDWNHTARDLLMHQTQLYEQGVVGGLCLGCGLECLC